MEITRNTKWVDFAPFATDERIAQLREKITDCAIFDFWQLTIGDFSEMITTGMPEPLQQKYTSKDATVYDCITIINAIDAFLTEFAKAIGQFEIQLTPEEKQASSVMPTFTPIESMLIFTRGYFGLKNFGEPEKITLLEYFLAKKDTYSNTIYQRALSSIQINSMKHK